MLCFMPRAPPAPPSASSHEQNYGPKDIFCAEWQRQSGTEVQASCSSALGSCLVSQAQDRILISAGNDGSGLVTSDSKAKAGKSTGLEARLYYIMRLCLSSPGPCILCTHQPSFPHPTHTLQTKQKRQQETVKKSVGTCFELWKPKEQAFSVSMGHIRPYCNPKSP